MPAQDVILIDEIQQVGVVRGGVTHLRNPWDPDYTACGMSWCFPDPAGTRLCHVCEAWLHRLFPGDRVSGAADELDPTPEDRRGKCG